MTRPTPNSGSPSALRSLSSLALLARYTAQEAPANERALTSLATVPADRQSLPAFDRAQRLLPHNTIARRTWLWRLTATPYENPPEWFPRWDDATTRAEMATVDAAWSEYLNALTERGLTREIEYTSSEGVRYASAVADVILHVHNHSTYHRGQLARLVAECGGTPAITDLISLTRRRIEVSGGDGEVVTWA